MEPSRSSIHGSPKYQQHWDVLGISKYQESEMIADTLFVVMAMLTFLGTSGSMIHIFKNLDR
jgi:hypothetical protein